MAEFSRNILVLKLQSLTLCRKKIRLLSRWLLSHQEHYVVAVSTWFEEIMKSERQQQLLFIYVADEVIQNSKPEGLGYGYEFGKVLLATFKHMSSKGIDLKTIRALDIILNSWEKKGFYNTQKMQEFRRAINPTGISMRSNKRNSASLESSHDNEKKPHLEKGTEPKKPRNLFEAYCRWADSLPQWHKDMMFKNPPGDKHSGNSKDLHKSY